MMMMLPVLLMSLALAPEGQQPPAPVAFQLGAVSVAGASRYPPAEVTSLSALKAGQPVTPSDLDNAVKQMSATGLFASLKYRYVTSGNRLDVTFDIEEPRWSMPVAFDNFVWLSDDELLAAVKQHVPTFDGTLPVNTEVTSYMTAVLQRLLDERQIRGRVEFALHNNQTTGKSQYLFSVKGTGLGLCALRVTGASVIPESQLVEAAAELTRRDYSRLYLTELANGTLGTMYRQRGYWRAEFRDPLATLVTAPGACTGVSVTLHVDEGSPYTWDRADWTGVSAITTKELDAALGMKPGDVADVTKIETGLRQVRSAYRHLGYMQQRSTMTPRLDDTTHRLVLDVTIVEGAQFRLGELAMTGMSDEDADALRKKWKLKAGDIYDDAYIQQFRSENGTPTRRLTLEPAIDPARKVIDLKIVATARR
jgi:outer membrane protein insertion porin family